VPFPALERMVEAKTLWHMEYECNFTLVLERGWTARCRIGESRISTWGPVRQVPEFVVCCTANLLAVGAQELRNCREGRSRTSLCSQTNSAGQPFIDLLASHSAGQQFIDLLASHSAGPQFMDLLAYR